MLDYHDAMAHWWVHHMEVLDDGRSVEEAAKSQFGVVQEETEELEDAFHHGSMEEIAEESVDVIVTIRILNAILGICTSEAYEAKMNYNLMKSGKRDPSGKVVDDTALSKPDFDPYTNGEKPW